MPNREWLHRQVTLGSDGLLFAATQRFLYGWNREGELVYQVGGDEIKFVGAYHFDGNHFLLCDARGIGKTHVFDREGNQLFESDFYTFFFRTVDDELFGFPLFHQGEEILSKFPFQAQQLRYQITQKGLKWHFGEPAFAKMTQLQMELFYNFKRNWIVKISATYHVINVIGARIYHYGANSRLMDVYQGNNHATDAPFTRLSLGDFVSFHDWFEAPKGVHETPDMRKWYRKWWFSFSCITGFYAYGQGFVVSYEVPDGPEEDRGGSRLYPQRLSLDFSPVGAPWRGEGMLMGVDSGQAVIFQPNPIFSEDGQPVAMKPTVLFHDLTRPGVRARG